MSRYKSQTGFLFHLLGNILSAVLGVVLLRGFGLLPNWGFEIDSLVAGSTGVLCFMMGRAFAAKATGNTWQEDGINQLVLSGLDESPTPILLLDPDRIILFANRSFLELAQVPIGRLVGNSLNAYRWIDPYGQVAGDAPWCRLIQDGLQHASADLVLPCFRSCDATQFAAQHEQPRDFQDGSSQVSCSALRDDDLVLRGVLVSFEVPVQKDRRQTNGQHAMVHLGHEIRSPMNALLGYIRLLKNGQSRDEIERQEQLEIVHRSGVRVLQLIDQILEHSKLQNGNLKVADQDCSLFSILTESKELFQLQAAEKGLLLNLVIRGSLPSVIRTDPLKLQQVVNNLVANAIKFTVAGSVNIYVETVTMEQVEYLDIRIIDSGIGIPQDELRQIFNPFIQLKSNPDRTSGGAGLGLAICRSLADMLGAQLEVQSAVATGSVFTLRLKIETADRVSRLTHREFIERESPDARLPVRSETNLLSGLQVLIVDDDASHRRLFQLYLENRGARTVQAENGKRALEIVKRHRVDMVLIDMQMPVMNGIETTINLRQMGFAKPIIGISANSEASPGCHDGNLGFSGWLQKPVESRALDLLLSRLLGVNSILASAGEMRLVSRPPAPQERPAVGDLKLPGDAAMETRCVQIPDLGQQRPVLQYLVHPAHSGEFRHTGSPVGKKTVRSAGGSVGNGPAQTVHPSLSAGEAEFADLAPLFLETLCNKLDEIKESCDGQRHQTVLQFVHWLKGTGAACGFHEFGGPVLELERAMKNGGDVSSACYLLEIETIANAIQMPVVAE